MIKEGLIININDIDDDKLREKVIDYFKTFKKGKLDDEGLKDLDDAEEKGNEKKDDEEKDAKNKIDNFFKTGVLAEKIEESFITEDNEISEEERQKNMDQTLIAMKCLIDNTDDGKRKERLEREYNFLKNSVYDKDGKFKSIEDSQKYSDEHMGEEIGGFFKTVKFLGTLSNTSSHEAQKDLRETYPDSWEKATKDFEKEIKNSSNKDKEDSEEKDEEGNILKQEEIIDDEGKKIKVATHTGPRGGKFYWPDGVPKDAEHKVYIGSDGKVKECMDLSDYLHEIFD